jgi:Tfp pilus assembly protein PilE
MVLDLVKEKAEIMARKVFEKLGKDEKADAGLFKLVIGVFIVAILIGALIPTAITSIVEVNKTGWEACTTATYNALPILIVVVIVAVLAGLAYRAFSD